MRKQTPFLLTVPLCSAAAQVFAERPNVIPIMTDDQGYTISGCWGFNGLEVGESTVCHFRRSDQITFFWADRLAARRHAIPGVLSTQKKTSIFNP